MNNRGTATPANDTWLTPPELIQACGKFDLDPCCPPKMPWVTATRMISLPEDGLQAIWKGRVWCNPPYSKPLPWIEKLAAHGNGLMLLPAKSPDTKWGQTFLQVADAVLFLKGRLSCHYQDGTKSDGAWQGYMVGAFGAKNLKALAKLQQLYGGVVMVRDVGNSN